MIQELDTSLHRWAFRRSPSSKTRGQPIFGSRHLPPERSAFRKDGSLTSKECGGAINIGTGGYRLTVSFMSLAYFATRLRVSPLWENKTSYVGPSDVS